METRKLPRGSAGTGTYPVSHWIGAWVLEPDGNSETDRGSQISLRAVLYIGPDELGMREPHKPTPELLNPEKPHCHRVDPDTLCPLDLFISRARNPAV